ncbi:hypothetical protein ACJ41O_003333 [Fusarium nematophilum]
MRGPVGWAGKPISSELVFENLGLAIAKWLAKAAARIRKVKCDETKPHCQRALQFFCEIAGPCLSGPTDPYFWTHLVLQFGNSEPAVKHSIVAISLLYEDETQQPEAPNHSLALRHYNAAIHELKIMDNQPLVLLACLLFVCIEFLQSNREAAIQHCNHGIAIMEHYGSASWTMEHLVPIFRRLSVFPFFFGSTSADFPNLAVLAYPTPTAFASFSEAQSMIDDIFNQTVRLIRCGDVYRFGFMRRKEPTSDLLEEQARIQSMLRTWKWKALFGDLDATQTSNEISRNFLWMRLVTTSTSTASVTWLSSPRVLELPELSPKFVFEMALTPMLFYVAMKCRSLDVRLEALGLIKVLGVPRENLWESHAMHALGRRMIEIEHGVILDRLGQPSAIPASFPGLPPDERRVRHFVAEPEPTLQTAMDGWKMCGRRVDFFMLTAEDDIYLHSEVLANEEYGHVQVSPEMPGMARGSPGACEDVEGDWLRHCQPVVGGKIGASRV